MVRVSTRPQKQLLFHWLDEEFKRSERRDLAIDFACGTMNFRPSILAQRYVGIDIDAARIALGKSKYPEVIGVVSGIEDVPTDLRGDFIVCVETIGINNFFQVDRTLPTLEKLVSATAAGGDFVFNVGPLAADLEDQISSLVERAFLEVKVYRYGAFNEERPRALASALALSMKFFPPLRTIGHETRLLYSCRGRRAEGGVVCLPDTISTFQHKVEASA